MIRRNKPEFLHPYMTMDETWIHHFIPKYNRQSSEWTAHDEPASKRGKMQQSAGKLMASVFWDAHGIIFIDYLEKGRFINNDYYIVLLDRLKGEIDEKQPKLKKKKVLLNQDNAPCDNDYFLFSDLKRMLAWKKFSSNEEGIAETEDYFEAKDKSYYKNGIEKLKDHYNQCIP
nr:histone-lysine N-methyltransferase SETMAR-like [Lepeophtheirus salmonis]